MAKELCLGPKEVENDDQKQRYVKIIHISHDDEITYIFKFAHNKFIYRTF